MEESHPPFSYGKKAEAFDHKLITSLSGVAVQPGEGAARLHPGPGHPTLRHEDSARGSGRGGTQGQGKDDH